MQRTVTQAAGWMVGLRWMIRGLGIARTVILAGILFPEDFGRAILAISIVMFVEAVTEMRVDYSLIRSRDNPDALNNAAWTLQIVRGLAAGLVIMLSAQLIGDFYEDPLLVDPLYLLAAAVFIGGFVNVGIAEFQRDMDFRKVFLATASSRICSLIAAVGVALLTQSFWAILIGYTVQRVVDVVVSFFMHPRRPRLGFRSIAEIGKHSKWLLLQGILFQVLLRLDVFLIGKLAGPAALGPYYLSKMIAELIGTEMSTGLRTALFAKFVQHSRNADHSDADLNFKMLADAAHISLLIGAPLSILLALCANDLVSVALEQRWAAAALYLQLFAIGALFGVADAAPLAVILAAGKTQMVAVRQATALAVFAPTLWFASQAYGLVGAGFAVVLTTIVSTLFSYVIAVRALDADWKTFWMGILRISIASAVLYIVAYGALTILPDVSQRWHPMHVVRILSASFLGLVAYGIAIRWQWTFNGRRDTFEKLVADAFEPTLHSIRRMATRS